MELILHYDITISGSVQGVGYRYSAVRTARSLAIKGFVKNLPDGKVYIEAEGTAKQLDKFIDWCYIGPAYARVDQVCWEESETKGYSGFDVKP